jgi:hypothetical protein
MIHATFFFQTQSMEIGMTISKKMEDNKMNASKRDGITK